MRGKGMVSRTCSKPQIQATARSMPMPKPECGNAAVFAEIKIPLEGFFGQIVLVNALQEQVVRGHALRSADDFAVAFGGQHVHAESELGALGIGFHVKRFHAGRVAMDHDGPVVER